MSLRACEGRGALFSLREIMFCVQNICQHEDSFSVNVFFSPTKVFACARSTNGKNE